MLTESQGEIYNKERRKALEDYEFQIRLRPSTTEKALFQQFDNTLHAHNPLASTDRLMNSDLPFPISIVYSDTDWMDSRGSRQIVRANRHFKYGKSQLHILNNSNHVMFGSNPRGFVELITADCFDLITHKYEC